MNKPRSNRSHISTIASTDLAAVHGGLDSLRLLATVAHAQAEAAAQDLEAAATKTSTTTTTTRQ